MSNSPSHKDDHSVIKLVQGQEYQARMETPSEMAQSQFSRAYLTALQGVRETIEKTKAYHNHAEWDQKLDRNWEAKSEFNNIIAFNGERGSGKTSAMISFRNLLVDQKWEMNNVHWQEATYDLERVKKHRFLEADLIDPSRFENRDTILGNIIGELYENFRDRLKNSPGQTEHGKKNKLITAFSQVFKSIQAISAPERDLLGRDFDMDNALEALDRLAAGNLLRKRLIELIGLYLDFMLKSDSQKESAFLVIPIDDLDMNIANAFQVIEEIRKFLMIPNVIVLMALKVDQMKEAVQQEYLKSFQTLRESTGQPDNEEIERMANLYLEKLLPASRLIDLPVVSSISIAKNENYPLIYTNLKGQVLLEGKSIERTVLDLVFQKTGIFHVAREERLHPILPLTLRELHNFLAFFYQLEDFENSNSETRKALLNTYRYYLINQWGKRNLTPSELNTVREFALETPPMQKNKAFIRIMTNRIMDGLDGPFWTQLANPQEFEVRDFENQSWLKVAQFNKLFVEEYTPLENILSDKRYSRPYTFGDVMVLLELLQEWQDDLGVTSLAFALESLYTIELQELMLTEETHGVAVDMVGGPILHPGTRVLPERDGNPREFITFRQEIQNIKAHSYCSNNQERSIKEIAEALWALADSKGQKEGIQNDEELRRGFEKDLHFLEVLFSFLHAGENTKKYYDSKEYPDDKDSKTKGLFGEQVGLVKGGGQFSLFVFDLFGPFLNTISPQENLSRIFLDKNSSWEDEKERFEVFRNHSAFFNQKTSQLRSPFGRFFQLEVLSLVLLKTLYKRHRNQKDLSNQFQDEPREIYMLLRRSAEDLKIDSDLLVSPWAEGVLMESISWQSDSEEPKPMRSFLENLPSWAQETESGKLTAPQRRNLNQLISYLRPKISKPQTKDSVFKRTKEFRERFNSFLPEGTDVELRDAWDLANADRRNMKNRSDLTRRTVIAIQDLLASQKAEP